MITYITHIYIYIYQNFNQTINIQQNKIMKENQHLNIALRTTPCLYLQQGKVKKKVNKIYTDN